ncbi:unnamed protein product [marine sediment metagenome]|uniref:Uncharacterized protein n=1 Tax=marine sediment metagenome TaxID=412755 RepID=X0UWP5_9ZZZZ
MPRIVNQDVLVRRGLWAVPYRLKAGPNGSGVNRMDTDDILAPHTPTKAPSNGSDCVLVSTGDKGPNVSETEGPRRVKIAVCAQNRFSGTGTVFPSRGSWVRVPFPAAGLFPEIVDEAGHFARLY